jgi:hypothetical protein
MKLAGPNSPKKSYSNPLTRGIMLLGEAHESPRNLKVKFIINLQDQGAGLPDGGFFTQDQFQKFADASLLPGQTPARKWLLQNRSERGADLLGEYFKAQEL